MRFSAESAWTPHRERSFRSLYMLTSSHPYSASARLIFRFSNGSRAETFAPLMVRGCEVTNPSPRQSNVRGSGRGCRRQLCRRVSFHKVADPDYTGQTRQDSK